MFLFLRHIAVVIFTFLQDPIGDVLDLFKL